MDDKKDLLQIKYYLENIYNNIDIENSIKLFQGIIWNESKDFSEYLLELAYDLDFYNSDALDGKICGLADRNGFYSYNTIKDMIYDTLRILNMEVLLKEQEDKILDKNLKNWYIAHKILPKRITIENQNLYLITDYNGVDDANYRIFLNPTNNTFGLDFLDKNDNSIIIEENIANLNEILENL